MAFIDLLKGICVFFVVLSHVNVYKFWNISITDTFRMPVFFFLSGLFFRTYSSPKEFFSKKANSLLVPTVFWLLFAFAFVFVIEKFMLHGEPPGLFTGYSENQSFLVNQSLWFLLCLFLTNAVFFVLHRYIQKHLLWVAIIVLAFFGCLLGIKDIRFHIWLDSALTALPFFYIGYLMQDSDFMMRPQKYRVWVDILIGVALLGVAYVIYLTFDNPGFWMFGNKARFHPLLAYFNTFLLIFGLYFVCRATQWVPIISYFGRYSIVVVCTNELIMFVLGRVVPYFHGHYFRPQYGMIVALLCCWIAIPICRRWFPYFIGQKPLIPISVTPKSDSNAPKA